MPTGHWTLQDHGTLRVDPVNEVDNWRLLGLTPGSDRATVIEARRRLSLIHHPDRGGNADEMALINRAADELLAVARSSDTKIPVSNDLVVNDLAVISVDRPSFTIDALPALAFECLLIACAIMGELVDDDPPYALEAIMRGWPTVDRETLCRFELVPDAGSTTVSILSIGDEVPNLDDLRDRLIAEINGLDYDSLQ